MPSIYLSFTQLDILEIYFDEHLDFNKARLGGVLEGSDLELELPKIPSSR